MTTGGKNEVCKKVMAFVLSAVLVLICPVSVFADYDNGPEDIVEAYNGWDEEDKEYLYELCQENDLDYNLLVAVIYNESRFQSDAMHLNTNKTTDWGLMQINDSCYNFLKEECGISKMKDLLDPKTNIS